MPGNDGYEGLEALGLIGAAGGSIATAVELFKQGKTNAALLAALALIHQDNQALFNAIKGLVTPSPSGGAISPLAIPNQASGLASGGSATSLIDVTKSWQPHYWQGALLTVAIDSRQYLVTVTDNDATSLSFSALANNAVVKPGSPYLVYSTAITISANTIGTIPVNIAALAIGNIPIDITAQSISQVGINFEAQNVGVYDQAAWSSFTGTEKTFSAGSFSVPYAPGVTLTLSYLVPTGKSLFVTQLSGLICSSDTANADLVQIGSVLLSSSNLGIVFQSGGNGGTSVTFPTPVVFEAGDLVTFQIKNSTGHDCYLMVAAAGYEV